MEACVPVVMLKCSQPPLICKVQLVQLVFLFPNSHFTGKALKLKFGATDIYLCCLQPNLGGEGLISDPPSRWWGHLTELYASFSSSNKKLEPG